MKDRAMNPKASRLGTADQTSPATLMPPTPRTSRSPHGEVLPDVETLIHGWQALLVNRARPYALQQEDGTWKAIPPIPPSCFSDLPAG